MRILHFAAHVGLEFDVSVVARALHLDELDLLWDLSQIEAKQGVVHDVVDVVGRKLEMFFCKKLCSVFHRMECLNLRLVVMLLH